MEEPVGNPLGMRRSQGDGMRCWVLDNAGFVNGAARSLVLVYVNDTDPHHWGLGDALMEGTTYCCALKNEARNLRFGRG